MKSSDLLTDAEIRTRLTEAAGDMRSSADADATALQTQQQDYAADLKDSAYADIVAEEPSVATFLPSDRYEGLEGVSLDVGSTAYEVAFNESRRSAMGAIAGGVDGYMVVVLQAAVDTIDELRTVTEELGVEATQLAAAAASGVLIPAPSTDVEDFQDALVDAKGQATLVSREIANNVARRQAARVAAGLEPAPDLFPQVSTVTGRALVSTPAASEPADRVDQGQTLVQGRPGQSATSVASDQTERLQELLRAPALERINYIAICAVLGMLSRSKSARARAKLATDKLKRVYAAIKNILSGHFVDDLQESLEKQAQASVTRALDFVQSKIDAVDGFLAVVARLPGPFVATVNAIGDVPDTSPVINSLSSLCGLKGSRFCDLKGLLEVAKSLDNELGLNIPKPPMFGRAVLVLDAPEATQVPRSVIVPGQEADLIVVSGSGTTLVARFSRASAPVVHTGGSSFGERPDAFGDGPGKIVIFGNGAVADVTVTYSAVIFNPLTGNYTFTVSGVPRPMIETVRGESDALALPGGAWDQSTTFPVSSSSITMRVPESQQRDIVFPCDLALGFGEQGIVAGEYDASIANTVRSLIPAFADWMVGLTIDLGTASANGVAATRTIATFVDAQTITYSGANVAATLAGNRGTFRVTVDAFEVRKAMSMAAGPHPDLKVFSLASPLARPHGRLRAIPQTAIHVIPDVRDEFLTSSTTPANANVRSSDVLPAGSVSLLATYVDPNQDAIFTPILTAAGTGKCYVDGQGPFSYTAVVDAGAAQLRFTLSLPTTSAFAGGVRVEVETTSLLDQFSVHFPDSWFAPIDTWLLSLGGELNRLEAKMCRLLSGSNQDIAASAAQLAILADALTFQLTVARFFLVAWIVPMTQAPALERSLANLRAIGATRAERQLREGRVADVTSMSPAEGTDDGATLIVAQAYQERLTSDEQYRVLSKTVAELRGRFEALVVAANATGDMKAAQTTEIERRRQAARRLEALQEKVP